MKKVAALVMLLAGLSSTKAHVARSSVFAEGWSTTQATTSHSENSSKRNAVANNSVVVNWSSICKDLCGAAFGGSACGEYCDSSGPTTIRSDNGKYTNVNLCSILCKFDLSGRNCECPFKSGAEYDRAPKNSDEFCNAMCKHYNISIDGCSECVPNESLLPPDLPLTSAISASSFPDSNSSDMESSEQTTSRPSKERTRTARTTEQTTWKFTTISSTTAPMDDDTTTVQSTTPDWSVVCQELCKEGKGGELCNCDLPPLTMKSN